MVSSDDKQRSLNKNQGTPDSKKTKRDRPPGSIALYIILGIGLLLIGLNLMRGNQRGETLSFGEFEKGLESGRFHAGNVIDLTFWPTSIQFQSNVTLDNDLFFTESPPPGKEFLKGEPFPKDALPPVLPKPSKDEELKSYRIDIGGIPDEALEALRLQLKERGIMVQGSPPPADWEWAYFAMMITLLIIFILFFRRIGGAGSAMSFGRSRGKMFADDDIDITFDDVAGIDEAVEELREVVEFLRIPEKYQALGGRIPRGVLLVGPPGTGKTLLAKAVAGEANVPFFSLSGSDFVEMFVGVGAARVRDMFAQAIAKSPAIIFIDELDALGKVRGGNTPGGHDEREQTLNALLVEMDGFSSNESVIVMGATNRPETLDPALMRPGRFDRHVLVDRPDYRGREAILRVHATHVKLDADVDFTRLAKITPGFVGADLANLVNEAALLAARKDRKTVSMIEFEEGIERVVAGLEKTSRIIHEDERQRVAYHECGHALVACSLPHVDPVHKISIIPRGYGALGYILQRPEEERHLITKTELQNRICVMLGGIAAEDLVYGESSTGAQNDLERGTDTARRMVMEFGMSPKLGRVNYRESHRSPFLGTASGMPGDVVHSEATLREIDLEVKRIVDECMQTALDILTSRREALEHMTRELMDKEVMDADELQAILDQHHRGPQLKPGTFVSKPAAETGESSPSDRSANTSSSG